MKNNKLILWIEFFLIIIIGCLSCFFVALFMLNQTHSLMYQVLEVSLGIVIQLGSYILWGYALLYIRDKSYPTAIACLLLSLSFCFITISASSSFLYTQKEATNKENNKQTKTYQTLIKNQQNNNNLLNIEMESKKTFSTKVNEMLTINDSESLDVLYEGKIQTIKNEYDEQIKYKKSIGYITTRGGVNDLTKEMNSKIKIVESEKNKLKNKSVNEIKKDIENYQNNINIIDKKIALYKKENINIEEQLNIEENNNADIAIESGYRGFYIKVFGSGVGNWISDKMYLVFGIGIEILIGLLIHILFIKNNFNVINELQLLFKKRAIDKPMIKEKEDNKACKKIKNKKTTNELAKDILEIDRIDKTIDNQIVIKNDINIEETNIQTQIFSLDEYLKNHQKKENGITLKELAEEIKKEYRDIEITSRKLGVELKKMGIVKTKVVNGYPIFDI